MTEASVLLKTNYGDIKVDLWSEQKPQLCRHFMQACLDQHFDKASFKRIVP